MSIYIKGMKKPKNCDECTIKAWEDEWYVCPFSGVTTLSIGCQNNSPLVEIPPHGRLIDADKFERIKYEIPIKPANYSRGFDEGVKFVQKLIMDAPTIIPADTEG